MCHRASGSLKGDELLNRVSDYQLVRMDYAPRTVSYVIRKIFFPDTHSGPSYS